MLIEDMKEENWNEVDTYTLLKMLKNMNRDLIIIKREISRRLENEKKS